MSCRVCNPRSCRHETHLLLQAACATPSYLPRVYNCTTTPPVLMSSCWLRAGFFLLINQGLLNEGHKRAEGTNAIQYTVHYKGTGAVGVDTLHSAVTLKCRR